MKRFLKSFFTDSEGNPQPIYFWATLFLILIFSVIIAKIIKEEGVSDIVLGTLAGLIVALIGMYNYFKKRGPGPGSGDGTP